MRGMSPFGVPGFLLIGLVVAGSGAEAANPLVHRARPPRNVSIRAWADTRGAVSPDGRFVAYLRRGLVIETTRTGRIRRRVKIKGFGKLRWSPDSRSVAFDTRDYRRSRSALYRYHVYRGKLQRIAVTSRRIFDFTFTPRGRLYYIVSDSAYEARRNVVLWRAGQIRPSLRFPNRGLRTRRYRQLVKLAGRHALTIARVSNPKAGRPTTELWLTSLATKRSRRVFPNAEAPAPTRRLDASGPVFSPKGDRLCYLFGPTLRCIDVRTGRDREAVRSVGRCALRYGGPGGRFSPDGKMLAVMGCAGIGKRRLIVHDFDTGLNRTVLVDRRFKGFAFQDREHLVLSARDYWPERYRYPKCARMGPAVARVNVETGAYEVLVADDIGYGFRAAVPGNPRVLYMIRGRDNTEDLVRVSVTRPLNTPRPQASVRDGLFTAYHANGRKKFSVRYRRGQPEGRMTRFYWNGNKLEEGHYQNGLPTGKWTVWWPDRIRFQQRKFVSGLEHGPRITWHRYAGRTTKILTTFARGFRHGPTIAWNHQGRKITQGTLRRNRRSGVWIKWHGNGQKAGETHYRNGKKHGCVTRWHKNGTRTFVGCYRNGRPEGRHVWYNSRGRVWQESHHKGGRRHGPYKMFWDNGRPRRSGHYLNGRRHGLWVHFDRWGRKKREDTFNNGKKHGVAAAP